MEIWSEKCHTDFNYSNDNTSIPNRFQSQVQETLLITHLIIAAIGFLSNVTVCLTILTKISLLKKSSNRLIFFLSINDTLTCCMFLVIPNNYVPLVQYPYPYPRGRISGPIFCALIASEYLFWASAYTSSYIISLLSFERAFMTLRPFSYSKIFTSQRINYMLILLVIFSLCISLRIPFNIKFVSTSKEPCLWLRTDMNNVFELTLFLSIFLIRFMLPMIVTCISSSYLVYRIRKLRRTITTFNSGFSNTNNTLIVLNHRYLGIRFRKSLRFSVTPTSRGDRKNPNYASRSNIDDSRKRRLTWMIIITIMISSICWIPSEIAYFFAKIEMLPYHNIAILITRTLVILNAAINPIIYISFSRHYRKLFVNKFINFFRCSCC